MFSGKSRTLSLVLCVSTSFTMLTFDVAGSSDRGFRHVAGERNIGRSLRQEFRRDYDHRATPLVILYSDDLLADQRDFSDSFLREKAVYQPSRSAAKIQQVSYEQWELGEARAARREAKMLEELDSIDIRFYRPNEAYDARFPSVVYLDTIRK